MTIILLALLRKVGDNLVKTNFIQQISFVSSYRSNIFGAFAADARWKYRQSNGRQ